MPGCLFFSFESFSVGSFHRGCILSRSSSLYFAECAGNASLVK